MKKFIYTFIFIIFTINVAAYNNIETFDDQSNIILTTTVYKNNIPTSEATCNLTIFNPHPNENIINLSVLMINKGDGIFIYNLTNKIKYNEEIYPLTLYCNDSSGVFGSDDRVGIKIGAKLYDYVIPGLILISISALLFFISFKVSEEQKHLKLLFFYLGHLFILSSMFYAQATTSFVPLGSSLLLIFQILIPIYLIIILVMLYLQWTDKLEEVTNILTGK